MSAGTVAAVILAAGESSRMGRPKQLLDWGGRTLLQHQVDTFVASDFAPVVVVLGARARQIRARTRCEPPCVLVENAGYRAGRATSVRVGVSTLPDDVDAVIIASVDQPCSAATLEQITEAWRGGGGRIVVPRLQGRNGHPALFDGSLLSELRVVEERSEGIRAVRRAHTAETHFVDVDDPLVLLDVNTPEEYEEAARRFAPRAEA